MDAIEHIEDIQATVHAKEAQAEQSLGAGWEVFPGIKKTPGVCGGWECIGNHRITVSGLVEWRKLGMSDKQLLDALPTLVQSDLDNAWEYARRNPDEMEKQILENNSDDE